MVRNNGNNKTEFSENGGGGGSSISDEGKSNGGVSSTPSKASTTRRTPLLGRLRKRRSRSAPSRPEKHRIIEDHFRVDLSTTNDQRGRMVVLPGLPKHENDWIRDSHDFFNLIMLVPVVVLNIMNWNWDTIMMLFDSTKNKHVSDAWTGEFFNLFFFVTFTYFLIDLIWIVAIPSCVKSPSTIIQHHIATLLYLIIPYSDSKLQWCMGSCMIVEVNTWFLIARRVFNKEGFPPWIIDLPPFFSLKVKLISVFFYFTWITIRCMLYPYLLYEFTVLYINWTEEVGTPYNILTIVPPLHSVFCLLNMKWSYDLLMSKIRYWRRKDKKKHYEVSKGL